MKATKTKMNIMAGISIFAMYSLFVDFVKPLEATTFVIWVASKTLGIMVMLGCSNYIVEHFDEVYNKKDEENGNDR